MISNNSFSLDWLNSIKAQPAYKGIDRVLLEKMILAMHLLESLKMNGLDFIFKGGTSLILLLDEPKRFSIDIDIIIKDNDTEKLTKVFDEIIKDSQFSRYEHNERSGQINKIPKAHYKFYYISAIDGKELPLLLDILFEDNLYSEIIERDIASQFLSVEGVATKVSVPSVNSITGDKLTAFAPNTTGIEYNSEKELEIIKQLFDLGILFDNITDFSQVAETYKKIAAQELAYRDLENNINNPLDDTINTALLLAKRSKNKGVDAAKFQELQRGINSFQGYLVSENFYLDNAIESAAKAALVAAKIKTENLENIEPFDEKAGITAYRIEDTKYSFLNRLSRQPNKSLYYWYHTIKLITG